MNRIAACAIMLVIFPAAASAQTLWADVTAERLGETEGWTHRVELADLDEDGHVDIIFANGGDYSTPGTPEANQAWRNLGGDAGFEDVSTQVFGDATDLTRVIKAGDLNADGFVDLLVGVTYGESSRLYLGGEGLSFREVSDTHLPRTEDSLGDVEFGDVDGDGDLDVVAIDWGPGDGLTNAGGPLRVWLNDGEAKFTEAESVPDVTVRMSWDVELVDVDNDLDLDVLVASKVGLRNELFINDGSGQFEVASDQLPNFIGTDGFEPMDMNRDGEPETNNYDFAFADFNGDGFLDLVTVNDGDLVDPQNIFHRREHVFFNDGTGAFRDVTGDVWPDEANTGFDDNAAVVFDFDSDGDPDFFLASLSGADRLLVNDDGTFRLHEGAVEGALDSPGTLGIAFADFDGDGRLDYAQSQGELAFDERVYLGTDALAADTAAPQVGLSLTDETATGWLVRARVHDNKSPTRAHDWSSVVVRWDDGEVPMTWYGEWLWRAELPAEATSYQVCAVDAAGNEACGDTNPLEADGTDGTKGDEVDDVTTDDADSKSGCATAASPSAGSALLFFVLALVLRRRRRTYQRPEPDLPAGPAREGSGAPSRGWGTSQSAQRPSVPLRASGGG